MLSVERGSIGIAAEYQVPEAEEPRKAAFFNAIRSNLEEIAGNASVAAGSPAGRERLRLADATDEPGSAKGLAEIIPFGSGSDSADRPIRISRPVTHAEEAVELRSFGSVTGCVYSLNSRRGNHFQMIDEATGVIVRGSFGDGLMDAMLSVYNKRATLAGSVTYRDGMPKSIVVRMVNKEASKLPSLLSLRGILEG